MLQCVPPVVPCKHNWVPISEAEDPHSQWVTKMMRADIERRMEEVGALLELASDTGGKLDDIHATASDRIENIAVSTGTYERLTEEVTDLKDSIGRMYTRKQAASMLQGAWRSKVARRNIMEMVKGAWQKFEDKATKKCYYLNTNTGRVTWEKPHLLGTEDLPISRGIRVDARRTRPKRTPRVFAKDMTQDQAARMLQGMYRARRAMKLIRKLIRENYKTAIDPESGKRYYYNIRTKETTWVKPRGLGSQNLEDEEKKTPRFRAWELTEDQAEELGTLIDSYNRLVDPKEMGSEYKVFAISSNGKVPVAF